MNPTQHRSDDPEGVWYCQICKSANVTDTLLGTVEGTDIHRLTCANCRAISHYDWLKGQEPPQVSLNGKFRRLIPGKEATP